MYQQGHTVVGLDVAEQAVRDVYEGNSLEYTVDNIEKGKLYKVNLNMQFRTSPQAFTLL